MAMSGALRLLLHRQMLNKPFALPLNDTFFTVTVTDSFNCKAHADVPVLVSPSLIIEAGQDQLICYGDGFNLNAQIIASGIPPVSLEWDNPSTLSDSSILNPEWSLFSDPTI